MLQNVSNVNVTNTSFTVQYTTVKCLEKSENYYVQLIYSSVTSTMSYVPSTTASFILTSLQPSSTTVYYTLQVFNTANVPVSSFIVISVALTSMATSSTTTLETSILTPTPGKLLHYINIPKEQDSSTIFTTISQTSLISSIISTKIVDV